MIYLASDHRGFKFKEEIKNWLAEWGKQFEDCGPSELNPEDDYPLLISKAAEKVSANPHERAIVFGHSGQGEAIVANKFSGVRAAVFYGGPSEIIILSREHNDANVLSVGASFVELEEFKGMVKKWLDTEFSGEARHARRIDEIEKIEETTSKDI